MTPRSEDAALFADAIGALLSDEATPARVRAIEAGESAAELWTLLDGSGFADALVPEAAGGAGLALDQVFEIWSLCGRHALPVPLADTMVARAWLAATGQPRPAGSIALAEGRLDGDGGLHCALVSLGRVAEAVLVQHDGGWQCLPADQASAGPAAFCLDRRMAWPADRVAAATILSLPRTPPSTRTLPSTWTPSPRAQASARTGSPSLPLRTSIPAIRTLQACVMAVQIAGALAAVFERTLQHANDRIQFGRPIGKFQAIQHQLAVMSEHVFAAGMAARLGCRDEVEPGWPVPRPSLLSIAVAKARTSQAALVVAETAHSIHGAIGFTAEYDLQLLTRRLHAWRGAAGSEAFWQAVAGDVLVDEHDGLTLDLLRTTTDLT